MATLKQYVNILGNFLTISVILLASFAQMAIAAESNFVEVEENTTLENFEWTQRPIIIFADSEKDPNFISQMEFKI